MSEKIASLYAEIGGTTAPLDEALGDSQAQLTGFESALGAAGDATDEFSGLAADAAEDIEDLGDASEGAGGKQETFRNQMRGLGDTLQPLTMGMQIYGQVLDEVRAGAERLGRSELPEALDRAEAAGQRLADSFLELKLPSSALTLVFPELDDKVRELTGGLIDLRDRDVIDWFTDAADGASNLALAVGNADIFLAGLTGAELNAEQQARVLTMTNQGLTESELALHDAAIALAASTEDARVQWDYAAVSAAQMDLATREAAEAASIASDVYGIAEQQLRELNITEGERHALEVAMKIASGQMTVEEMARENAVINLTQALDAGLITNQQYLDGLNEIATSGEVTSVTLGATATAVQTTGGAAAEAADQVDAYSDSVRAIPAATTTTITTQWINTGQVPTGGGAANSGANVGMADGGIATGPSSGYPMTLHGTEAVIPLSNGSVPVEIKGGSGGGSESMMWELIGLMRNLPVQISRAIRDALLAMGK